ncbi:indolepyruvate ferredoxin oxidoreductase subunit alpha [Pelotomaculum propionicicum]|nr:4Fe-4S binding protein [Pelotomaculum propionicicum]NLI11687.1 4Fe-4S binding protein [Peptococcaceae bacterium]
MVETVSAAYPKKIVINKKWCKGCGICAGLCPKVLAMSNGGKAIVVNQPLCTGCRRCESHCPDFAISLKVETDE